MCVKGVTSVDEVRSEGKTGVGIRRVWKVGGGLVYREDGEASVRKVGRLV